MSDFLSITEAAGRSGMSSATFARRLAAGRGPETAYVGRHRIVPRASFEAWLAGQPRG